MTKWKDSWRTALEDVIRQGPKPAGEIFDCIEHLIPLHHAARSNRGNRNHEYNIDMPVRKMRWLAFSGQLHYYHLMLDRQSGKKAIARDTLVIPLRRSCKECGKSYFGTKVMKFCCHKCRVKHSWADKKRDNSKNYNRNKALPLPG